MAKLQTEFTAYLTSAKVVNITCQDGSILKRVVITDDGSLTGDDAIEVSDIAGWKTVVAKAAVVFFVDPDQAL